MHLASFTFASDIVTLIKESCGPLKTYREKVREALAIAQISRRAPRNT
jgi:hypothetical protein